MLGITHLHTLYKRVHLYMYLLLLLFCLQLSSLYEVKPPISRAKMTSVTKSAIKAIKLYKHVVQSVEKFIQKVNWNLHSQ